MHERHSKSSKTRTQLKSQTLRVFVGSCLTSEPVWNLTLARGEVRNGEIILLDKGSALTFTLLLLETMTNICEKKE